MKKFILTSIISILCALMLEISPSMSYFSDIDTSATYFDAYDALSIKLYETDWDSSDKDDAGVPKASSGLVPLQHIAKNPSVFNEGPVSAWVLLEIRVPKAEVLLVDHETQKILQPAAEELFSYQLNMDANWEELSFENEMQEHEWKSYYYLFKEPLAAGESSDELFKEVRLNDIVEGSFTGSCSIEVNAFAVQAKGISSMPEAKSYFSTLFSKGGEPKC